MDSGWMDGEREGGKSKSATTALDVCESALMVIVVRVRSESAALETKRYLSRREWVLGRLRRAHEPSEPGVIISGEGERRACGTVRERSAGREEESRACDHHKHVTCAPGVGKRGQPDAR